MKTGLTLLAAAAVLGFLFLFLLTGAPPPSFVIISVDTLRADHLGCYGNDRWGRSPSPAIDRLAAAGLRFDNCFAPRAQTHPSMASMLFGTFPITHGLRENGLKPASGQTSFVQPLREAGYATAGFVANLKAMTLKSPARPTWWTHGFDKYGDGFGGRFQYETGDAVTMENQWAWDERVEKQALHWIERTSREQEKPFCLWVHFYDPHKPFVPNESCPDFYPDYEGPLDPLVEETDLGPFDRIGPLIRQATLEGRPLPPAEHEKILACYDASLAGVDRRIESILDALEKNGMMENTWIFFLSDHGEELGDHNNYYYHGASIYDSALRIPLIVKGPGSPCGEATSALVQNLEIAPTVLDLAGLTPPDQMEGYSIKNLLLGEEAGREREFAFAEWQDLIYSVSDGKTKYIFNPRGACPVKPPWGLAGPDGPFQPNDRRARGFSIDIEELYDLTVDRGERKNLAAVKPELARVMRGVLSAWLREPGRRTDRGLDEASPEELREIIQSLGYGGFDPDRREVRFRTK